MAQKICRLIGPDQCNIMAILDKCRAAADPIMPRPITASLIALLALTTNSYALLAYAA
jgi:hypothetical protein